MPLPDLLHSTGFPHLDRAIAGVVAIYEAAFPARIRGYYLVGSLSRGIANAGSDIDMEILFKDAFLPDEPERLQNLRQGCRALSPIHLDLTSRDEATLAQSDTVALKSASTLVPSKDDMPRLYSEHVNDQWTDYITEVHDLCRLQWQYAIPTDASDRVRLRGLCARTLAYENHVMTFYQGWLKSELERGDSSVATERLQAFKFA